MPSMIEYPHGIFLTKNSYAEYLKNSYNVTITSNPNKDGQKVVPMSARHGCQLTNDLIHYSHKLYTPTT